MTKHKTEDYKFSAFYKLFWIILTNCIIHYYRVFCCSIYYANDNKNYHWKNYQNYIVCLYFQKNFQVQCCMGFIQSALNQLTGKTSISNGKSYVRFASWNPHPRLRLTINSIFFFIFSDLDSKYIYIAPFG